MKQSNVSKGLVISELTKKYSEDRLIFEKCSFTFPVGQISLITGPNGCGKSTMLKMISRLDRNHQGLIYFDGQTYDRPSPHVMLLHQSLEQLFFWLNVKNNVVLPLLLSKTCNTIKEAEKRAFEALEIVGMSGYLTRYPYNLSGGEKQRVALARALAFGSKVLLLDEPFSAIDKNTRIGLIKMLADLAASKNMVVIIVTHNPEELDDCATCVLDLS